MNEITDLQRLKTNMSRVIIEHNYSIVGDIEELLTEATKKETIRPGQISDIVEGLQAIREVNIPLYKGVLRKF